MISVPFWRGGMRGTSQAHTRLITRFSTSCIRVPGLSGISHYHTTPFCQYAATDSGERTPSGHKKEKKGRPRGGVGQEDASARYTKPKQSSGGQGPDKRKKGGGSPHSSGRGKGPQQDSGAATASHTPPPGPGEGGGSVDEQLRALAKQAAKDSEYPLLTQEGLEDFFRSSNFSEFLNENLDPTDTPALGDIMEESRPKDLYHHVRYREAERNEKWNLGPLEHGVLPLELKRAEEREQKDHLRQQTKAQVDETMVQVAANLADLLNKQGVDLKSSSNLLSNADQIREWSPIRTLAELSEKQFEDQSLHILDNTLSEMSLQRNTTSDEDEVQIQVLLLKLSQLAQTDIDKIVNDRMDNNRRSDRGEEDSQLLEPDEEYMKGIYSSYGEYKKDYLNLTRHLDPRSHKILPDSLETGAPEDLADTARTLEENQSLTSQESAEMLQMYADNIYQEKREGRVDRHGQYHPKHWRDSEAKDSSAVEFPEELMKHQHDPWHIDWDVDRSVHNEEVYGAAESSFFEDEVDPASYQGRESKSRTEQSSPFSQLPSSFMGTPIEVLREKFNSDQELLNFLKWAREEEITSSRGRRKRRSRNA
eukprot:gb/GECG01009812.1/.p1 GENE.gb/GECG01009812.1/~~gb/GECG01009812.1/.p1  ORF type:complete len:592 (+),score=96.85 gb/GECG01009812.1/:1-1776(+)